MKLRSSIILTLSVVATIFSGFALNPSTPAIAEESQAQTEFQKRRGRWKNLSPEEREAKRSEKAAQMKEKLGLSDAQSSQIEAIREKYRPQKEAIRQEAQELRENNDREGLKALRSKVKELRKDVKAEIKEVLTEEQRQTLQDLKAQRRSRRGARRSFRE